MPELTLYDDYSREDVHANFAPDTVQELHGLTGKESAAAQVFSRDRKKFTCAAPRTIASHRN